METKLERCAYRRCNLRRLATDASALNAAARLRPMPGDGRPQEPAEAIKAFGYPYSLCR